ncbi:MAG: hypothetical protein CL916_07980 [Deltaproteobacteria bacterium]|nr:hypothetical protein [Deltaproteobacteria bacterium]
MLFVIISLFVACQSKGDDSGNPEDTGDLGIDCTSDFRSSALVTVLDQEGSPLLGVDVSYTVDGVSGTYIDSWENGTYVVGGEEAGDFIVSMYAEIPQENDPCCSDVGQGTLEFTIDADECHVITQEFETSLEWDIICVEVDENGLCE